MKHTVVAAVFSLQQFQHLQELNISETYCCCCCFFSPAISTFTGVKHQWNKYSWSTGIQWFSRRARSCTCMFVRARVPTKKRRYNIMFGSNRRTCVVSGRVARTEDLSSAHADTRSRIALRSEQVSNRLVTCRRTNFRALTDKMQLRVIEQLLTFDHCGSFFLLIFFFWYVFFLLQQFQHELVS